MQRLKLLLPHRFPQRRWLYASDIFCLDSITLLNVHLSLPFLRQKIINVADANLHLLHVYLLATDRVSVSSLFRFARDVWFAYFFIARESRSAIVT